ncbi:MAG: T9SS type A sorting domain-containing protein, partial [Bacteroidota bacterium]
DSLQFTLRSSDVGAFGMNTPAYFCMDQLQTRNFPTALVPQAQLDVRFYPNPVQDIMQVEWQQSREGQLQIVDMAGTIVRRSRLQKGTQQISLEDLAAGLYLLRLQDGELVQSETFVKQ